MTLRSKTIIGIALIEALALGVLIISGLNWFKSSNETSLEVGSQNLVSVFAQASRDAVIATDLAYLDSFARSVVSEHKLAYIRIVNQDGIELTLQGDYTGVDTNVRPFDASDGVYDVAKAITLGDQTFGVVEMGVHVEHVHQMLSFATHASLVIAFVEMSLVALFSFALGSYLMKRLDLLRTGVIKVSQQGPGSQISISGNDEVTRVGEAFNQMSRSLAQAQNKLQQEHQTQQQLSAKISQLAEVAEHARDTIIITHPDGTIAWVNSAFEQLTEYSLEEVVGKSPGELLQGEDTDANTVALLSQSVRSHSPVRVEILNYTKSRRPYWVELELSPVFDDGELLRFIAVERDITDRREMEKRLSSALDKSKKATQAKSEFLANMSHEIRTPMNAIMGISEILLENENRREPRELLLLLHKSANNLVTIINDILDYSKVEAGKLTLVEEEFDLRSLVESCTALCAYQADKKNLKLLVDMPLAMNTVVVGDKGRINQILLNLIGNAVKFTDEGHVLLKVRESELGFDFSVSDTGIGIPEDRLTHIMDKFEQVDTSATRRHEGTGLGLAISKRLISMYNGELCVRSDFGNGSCFSFSLQLPKRSQPHSEPVELNANRLLLIDDYQPRVEHLMRLAKEIGIEVTHRNDWSAAQSLGRDLDGFDRIIASVNNAQDRDALYELDATESAAKRVLFLAPCVMEEGLAWSCERDRLLPQPVTQHKLQTLYSSKIQKRRALSSQDNPDFSNLHLLVAEDSHINRILIEKMLQDTGVKLTLAEDGVEAVELYKQLSPDLVITDISMPNKDGFGVTKDIRELQENGEFPWCPIVAFSAHAMQEEQQKSIALGMNDYLTKPVQKSDLLDMIAKWGRHTQMAEKHASG
ncbi:response regulator [Vibrio parahaemolyticus]|uniref:response regulator n=1 Tax=Vibrio parahaemolyticus TaxID=670 RepID=UPI00038E194E|nr:response regulator [Vibrio parahaemolyticus]EJG0919804.1 response regulator [Vibrio parahaemolyticus O1:K68]EJG0929304.1 response regulator [Vibrio parahaemolyticus O1]EJG0943630.1 response regulator [Vibrio parahaemolyticus O10]EQM51369.1 sensory box protein [Vibrio parahaemolyticus VPCR-2010]ANQ58202.1 chemotaxis protein CheY [Vibrio parahaemolyticus]